MNLTPNKVLEISVRVFLNKCTCQDESYEEIRKSAHHIIFEVPEYAMLPENLKRRKPCKKSKT